MLVSHRVCYVTKMVFATDTILVSIYDRCMGNLIKYTYEPLFFKSVSYRSLFCGGLNVDLSI